MESPVISPSTQSGNLSPSAPVRANGLVLNANIRELIRDIEANRAKWSFGDKLGVAYHFVGNRLYKTNNVLNRSGVRSRIEIRSVDQFFVKLLTILEQNPFVKVELCCGGRVSLMYCHSKLVTLEPGSSVLLIGDVCLVRGHFNNYFVEPIPVTPSTRVRLYSRTYEIRISSHRHTIFIRTEDLVKDRVRLEPLFEKVDADGEGKEGGGDGDSSRSSSEDEDGGETDGENSFDGGTSADSNTSSSSTRGRMTPQLTPPGQARRTTGRTVAAAPATPAIVRQWNAVVPASPQLQQQPRPPTGADNPNQQNDERPRTN